LSRPVLPFCDAGSSMTPFGVRSRPPASPGGMISSMLDQPRSYPLLKIVMWPAGAFDQNSAMVAPTPSQVYSAGSVPPSTATGLVSVKAGSASAARGQRYGEQWGDKTGAASHVPTLLVDSCGILKPGTRPS